MVFALLSCDANVASVGLPSEIPSGRFVDRKRVSTVKTAPALLPLDAFCWFNKAEEVDFTMLF